MNRPRPEEIVDYVDESVPQTNWGGVSAETWQELAGVDPDDRTENLAVEVSKESGLGEDSTACVLLALSHIDWAGRPEVERATAIDYVRRLLGEMGIKVVDNNGQNG